MNASEQREQELRVAHQELLGSIASHRAEVGRHDDCCVSIIRRVLHDRFLEDYPVSGVLQLEIQVDSMEPSYSEESKNAVRTILRGQFEDEVLKRRVLSTPTGQRVEIKVPFAPVCENKNHYVTVSTHTKQTMDMYLTDICNELQEKWNQKCSDELRYPHVSMNYLLMEPHIFPPLRVT